MEEPYTCHEIMEMGAYNHACLRALTMISDLLDHVRRVFVVERGAVPTALLANDTPVQALVKLVTHRGSGLSVGDEDARAAAGLAHAIRVGVCRVFRSTMDTAIAIARADMQYADDVLHTVMQRAVEVLRTVSGRALVNRLPDCYSAASDRHYGILLSCIDRHTAEYICGDEGAPSADEEVTAEMVAHEVEQQEAHEDAQQAAHEAALVATVHCHAVADSHGSEVRHGPTQRLTRSQPSSPLQTCVFGDDQLTDVAGRRGIGSGSASGSGILACCMGSLISSSCGSPHLADVFEFAGGEVSSQSDDTFELLHPAWSLDGPPSERVEALYEAWQLAQE
jgi:hypothetical protein